MTNPMSFFCVCLLLFLVLLIQVSSGADYRYDSCVQKWCKKGPGIKFPFYINGEQESLCGLFMVYCGFNGGYPMIRLSDNDYVITEISYEQSFFWVHNAAVDTIARNCFFEFSNLTTLQPSMNIVSSSRLHLLSRCSRELPEELNKYKVGCSSRNSSISSSSSSSINSSSSGISSISSSSSYNGTIKEGWEIAILGGDENLSTGIQECGVDVVVPVDLPPEEGGGGGGISNGSVVDFEGLLRKGFALNWTTRNCTQCEQSGGRCGIDFQTNGFRCFCSYGYEDTICKFRNKKSTQKVMILVIAVAGSVAVVSIVILALLIITGKKRVPWWWMSYCWIYKQETQEQIEKFLKNNYGLSSLAPKRYNYSDLKKITNSFDTKLGEGGYGSVYKGKLKDGRLVAVKVLKKDNNGGGGGGEEFINEVESISRTSHVNIVTLLGFCFQVHNNKRALIYEFMSNGSLDKFIYGSSGGNRDGVRVLHQSKLYKIAVGIARGLEYLHKGCNTRILHFDIKPQNILLDENFCPKISDFGLAKLYSRTNNDIDGISIVSEMENARGTIGYIAPEIICKNIGGVSHKSDVYSYGMMVLEMVGGRRNADSRVDRSSQKYFPHWIYTQLIMNHHQQQKQEEEEKEVCGIAVMNEEEKKQLKKMIMVSLWCIQTNPSSRPTIGNVIEMLEGPLENIQMPPKPFLYSLSTSSSSSSSQQVEDKENKKKEEDDDDVESDN